jgi:Cft2 family RNA processing exonuclease/nucleotide-binding universal stress UspA family protein
MKITFLGGADEVGASGTLIEIGGRRILIDCGIRPSPKARYGLAGDQLPDLSLLDAVEGVDLVLVTHAHTDHTGALELVLERFPHAPVYATPPTVALTRVLHQDARRIMQSRLEEEGELPLFDDVAVERLVGAFEAVPFNTRLALAPGLAATFYPAGHIAGAAMIGLESDEGRVLVSGDLSLSPQRTVGVAKLPPFEPDVLILESTYGGRLHANRAVQERRMVETVREVTGAGGKVLIPAFALGRAQEILLILSEFQRRGELPAVPVWADGMVRAVCQVYSSFADALPLALQEQGASFFQGTARPVQSGGSRNALIWQADPAIIVSSSGMLAGGPSTAYARAFAGQPQHAILLTGYQDEESPGRRLQEMAERGRGTLWLGKDKVDVHCRLGTYSLSAHADEGQLISMVETLNPAHVILVHGEASARASLAKALVDRKRNTYLPAAGQTLTFHFEAAYRQAAAGIGRGRPLEIHALWQAVAGTAGGYFHLHELAQTWWGQEVRQGQLDSLVEALAQDAVYFSLDPRRENVYRARPSAQVEVTLRRREQMARLRDLPGQWVALRAAGDAPRLARASAVAADFFWVEAEEGEPERAWPEDLLRVFGRVQPDAAAAQSAGLGQHPAPGAVVMEPNQALAQANRQFPREARMRKAGYRLDQHILALTFDFPDVARERYAAQIADLQVATGWTVEILPEANQSALFTLAQEVLRPGWRVTKGPALHRQAKQVAITISGPSPLRSEIEQAQQHFQDECGFDLLVSLASAAPQVQLPAPAPAKPDEPWEINAAYAAIKAALEGTTLYKTSLKGTEIQLSFISPQVGERYHEQFEALSQQTGYPLRVSPQPNQGAILEAARALLARRNLAVVKGPGIYPERVEVVVTVGEPPEEEIQEEAGAEFMDLTGYRLVLNSPPSVQQRSAAPPAEENVVMIPVERVQLRRFQRELALDPAKIEKAAERARRLGKISPPLQVRRVEDGYLLLDGLYRLRAAESLGLKQVPAIVE